MKIFGDRIFTPHLELKRIESEDLGLLVQWCSDPLAYGSYLTPERYSLEQLRGQWASGSLWSERNKIMLIQLRDGAAIGTIHYWLRTEAPGTAVVALKIACPEYRSKGYGTEAQKYLVMFLFNRMNLRSIEMYTDINNLSQQHCLKKLGFELVDSMNYDDHGVSRTGHLYRLNRDRFLQQIFYHYA
jgi:RimJ/RimL family protein N-acetyltransferase